VSFGARTLSVASQRVFMVVSVYFVIDSVRKLLDIPSISISNGKITEVLHIETVDAVMHKAIFQDLSLYS